MTGLSLKNPIAILMICIGLVVFALVVTPRMSVDTFPELTPPVLVIGTLAPGLGPKDVEKTITWRIEKYVSATPGVDHVESISRNNLSASSTCGSSGGPTSTPRRRWSSSRSRSRWRRSPSRSACCRRSCCSTTPRTRRWCRWRSRAAGSPGRSSTTTPSTTSSRVLEGIPGVASASINGGRQRQINVVVDPLQAPGARRHLRGRRARPWRSRTRSCRRASSSPRASTPTSTPTPLPPG